MSLIKYENKLYNSDLLLSIEFKGTNKVYKNSLKVLISICIKKVNATSDNDEDCYFTEMYLLKGNTKESKSSISTNKDLEVFEKELENAMIDRYIQVYEENKIFDILKEAEIIKVEFEEQFKKLCSNFK